jgi:hypothetical protein
LKLFSPTRSATTNYKPKTKELNNPKSILAKTIPQPKRNSFPKKKHKHKLLKWQLS